MGFYIHADQETELLINYMLQSLITSVTSSSTVYIVNIHVAISCFICILLILITCRKVPKSQFWYSELFNQRIIDANGDSVFVRELEPLL